MSLRSYVNIWVVFTLIMAMESYALNRHPSTSILAWVKVHKHLFPTLNLDPAPGKDVSIWAGWLGIGTMLLTNLYIFRKRWSPLKKLGSPAGWLDFHIFCGLIGPTFILFHTNFKIGGLVAVSFWSMVISFASGVVGRYFYLQLVSQKTGLEREAEMHDKILSQYQERMKTVLPLDALTQLKKKALQLAGAVFIDEEAHFAMARAMASSISGDIALHFGLNKMAVRLPETMRLELKEYVVLKRRVLYLEHFRQIMGYWHAFHMPFAVFMYIVAAIHIATALLLMV